MKTLLTALACLAAALGAAGFIVTGSALAGAACSTNVASEVAAATVVDRGNAWSQPGQPDLWEVTLADLNESVDVYAVDDPGARAAATSFLQAQVDDACKAATTTAGATTAAAPSTVSPEIQQQADQLASSATVTYLGNAWGPVPLYEVAFPSLNETIDVAANSASDARTAAAAALVAQESTASAAAATTQASTPQTVSAGDVFSTPPTAPANDPISPAASYLLLNPSR